MVRRTFTAWGGIAAALALWVALAGTGAAQPAVADSPPPAVSQSPAVIDLPIVGGLGGISQYERFEKPFWEDELRTLSHGRIRATIRPIDGGGASTQDMLLLMRLGVVPMGTSFLSMLAGDEPELNVIDLPALNPDMATLRRTVAAFRDRMTEVLDSRYSVKLLGVYVYPAQVVFCDRPFNGLRGLAGLRVRTSSVAQSEVMQAVGAIPTIIPFAEIVDAVETGVVDCAITGTFSGYEIGLPNVTTHVHAMALSWGISIFGANRDFWASLPPDVRDMLTSGIADLEKRIWQYAEEDTLRGLACSTGSGECGTSLPHAVTLVPISAEDEELRRKLLEDVVLPGWIARCGTLCVTSWNNYLAGVHGITAKAPGAEAPP